MSMFIAKLFIVAKKKKIPNWEQWLCPAMRGWFSTSELNAII